MRSAEIKRSTNETVIRMTLELDGSGAAEDSEDGPNAVDSFPDDSTEGDDKGRSPIGNDHW